MNTAEFKPTNEKKIKDKRQFAEMKQKMGNIFCGCNCSGCPKLVVGCAAYIGRYDD